MSFISEPVDLSVPGSFSGILPLSNGGTGDGSTFSWTGGGVKLLTANSIISDGTSFLFGTPNGAVTGSVTAVTGNATGVGGSGSFMFRSGGSTGAGPSGSVAFMSGNAPFNTSGNVSFLVGAGVNVGSITIQGGVATTGTVGVVALVPGFNNVSTGFVELQDSFNNPVVSVSDAGAGGTSELGFFGVTPIQRPTTAFASAAFVANAGVAVNTLSTFDGYTLEQIVRALRTLGLLT